MNWTILGTAQKAGLISIPFLVNKQYHLRLCYICSIHCVAMATKHINHNVKAQVINEIIERGIKSDIVDEILKYARENGNLHSFYGNWDVEDVAVAFLWYLVCGPSYRKVYMKMKIPKSNLEQHFGTMRRILLVWAETKVKTTSAEERKAMAAHLISDQQFKDISGYVDCSDFCVVPQRCCQMRQLLLWAL